MNCRDAQAHPDTGAILVDAEGPVFCGGLDFAGPVPDEIFTFGRAKPRSPS